MIYAGARAVNPAHKLTLVKNVVFPLFLPATSINAKRRLLVQWPISSPLKSIYNLFLLSLCQRLLNLACQMSSMNILEKFLQNTCSKFSPPKLFNEYYREFGTQWFPLLLND